MVLYFIILFALIVGNAVYDWYRIERLRKTFTKKMYRIKTLIRASIMTANALLLIAIHDKFQIGIWNMIALITVQSSIFWISFDALLNILRGRDWDYLGKTADSDTLFKGDQKAQLGIKLLYLFLSLGISILRF